MEASFENVMQLTTGIHEQWTSMLEYTLNVIE